MAEGPTADLGLWIIITPGDGANVSILVSAQKERETRSSGEELPVSVDSSTEGRERDGKWGGREEERQTDTWRERGRDGERGTGKE